MRALRQCWRNWSIRFRATGTSFPSPRRGEGGERSEPGEGRSDYGEAESPSPRPSPLRGEGAQALRLAAALHLHDLAAVDLDQIDARHVLRALLAGGALLDEGDVAVDALQLHVPQRLLDRLGLGRAGRLDRGDDGGDAVIAAEAFGE